jgi:hypothetical protein
MHIFEIVGGIAWIAGNLHNMEDSHHFHSWGRILGRLRYADRGGQFQMGRDSRCTPSSAHQDNSDIKIVMRSYVAFTIPPYTDASSLKHRGGHNHTNGGTSHTPSSHDQRLGGHYPP